MQGTVGHWCAILILALAAAYGIGMYFSQQTKFEQMEQSIRESQATDLVNLGNENVGRLMVERQQALDELARIRTIDLAETRERLARTTRDPELEKDLSAKAEIRYKELEKKIEILENTMKEQSDVVRKATSADTDLEENFRRVKGEFDKSQVRIEELARDKKALETDKANLTASALNRIRALQREKAMLLEAINKKTEAVRRRASGTKDEADGKIIAADVNNGFVVVDIGRINNLHRGMRFDVMRSRMNRMDKIATIEITKVGPSTSEGIILNEPPIRKVCPYTGYVASDPEERYSPYAAGDGNSVIPLVAMVQEDVSSMKDSDPIIVGDMIVNPFFEKDKSLKIAFAGEPVVYPVEVLRNQIKEAGAIWQEEVGIDTDFLVVGRFEEKQLAEGAEGEAADEAAERYNKQMDIAAQYGIPLLREVELYEFLRN